MLKINKLHVKNFGPYKETQTINFPEEDGVTIVYGENMRGKTILLNAIRYALLGKVLMRGEREVSLHQIGNWEKAAEGEYGFKIILEFEEGGNHYELTRQLKPRPGVETPGSDHDYVEEKFLRLNGDVMGPDEADIELENIMPEKISRFFLFDGELLQQYEELLRDESDMGRQIKEAIERILGVPVLQNARADMRRLYEDAQQKEAKAAQKNQKTQELGNHHAELIEQRKAHVQEIERLKGELESKKEEKSSTEEALRKSERLRGLLDERDRLFDEVAKLDEKINQRKETIKNLMKNAWIGILAPRLKDIQSKLESESERLRKAINKSALNKEFVKLWRSSLSSDECQTCGERLTPKARHRIEEFIQKVEDPSLDKEEKAYEKNINKLSSLRELIQEDEMSRILELMTDIDDYRLQKHTKEDRIDEIKEQTKNLDESEIRKLSAKYDKIVREIGIIQSGIQKQGKKIDQADDDIRKIEQQLERLGGLDLAAERSRRELCSSLESLFSEVIDIYRDELRDKVKEDATDLFCKLTSEPDYAGLDINESYGLTIIHKDSQPIPVRSAGAEHIVALSLMGSLQKNAPMRGPIIMDSPFGRLDHEHTTKVVKSLPDIANQAVLLVYESELDPRLAREQLLGKLKSEYRIVRQTARYSTIEQVGG